MSKMNDDLSNSKENNNLDNSVDHEKIKKMDTSEQLGTQPIGKLLLKLSIPTIAAQVVNALYNIVDRIYIGHIPGYGDTALTAMGVCLSLTMIIAAFAALTSVGGAARAAIMLGKGDKKQAELILGNCTLVTTLVGILLTIIFIVFAEPFLMAFGATEGTIGYAVTYLRIYAIGTVSVELALGLNAFITTQGFSLVGMLSVVIGAVLNIILDPILIYGFDMGVKGAAIATVISQTASAIWAVAFLLGKKTILKIKLKNFKISLSTYMPCVFLGASPFIMQFTESVISICFNVSLRKYGGEISIQAMTILYSVMTFAMLPLSGLTQGAQPITSYNYGAGNKERVKETIIKLLKICLIYSISLWALCMICPKIFIKMFTSTPDRIEYAIKPLRVYMCMSLIFGAQVACQQSFIALGNAKASFFLAVLRKVILLIPFIFAFPYIFTGNKVMAVFMAEPVADFFAVMTTTIMFYISFRKYMKSDAKDNIPLKTNK